MECLKYAFNILIVSDGIYSIHLGGLQADLKRGSRGGGAPPVKKKMGLGPGPIWPIGPGSRAHLAHWAWVPFGPIGPHPTGIQASYRSTGILHIYRHPTGIQASYRYTGILQVYKGKGKGKGQVSTRTQ